MHTPKTFKVKNFYGLMLFLLYSEQFISLHQYKSMTKKTKFPTANNLRFTMYACCMVIN